MKTIYAILCSIVFSVSLMAQTKSVDEELAGAIANEQWADVNRIYSISQDKIESACLKKLSGFLIHHFYNRPDSALAIGPDLLNNYQQELGASLPGVIYLFANDLAKTGNYQEGANVIKMMCDAWKQSGDSLSEPYQSYYNYYQEYQSLADIGHIMAMEKPENDLSLPFTFAGNKENPISIHLNGTLNGQDEQFIWDTGAGVNIISTQFATKHHLKIRGKGLPVSGMGITESKLAIADSVCIGQIKLYNVPFYVVETETGNAEANKVLSTLYPVIGLPVMQKLEEFQLDLDKHQLVIPRTLTPSPYPMPNIYLNSSNNLYLQLFSNNQVLEMKFDTGASNTLLSSSYYSRNKEIVDLTGKKDSLRMAGIGGVKISQVFVLPKFTYSIGKNEFQADSVHIDTEIAANMEKDGTMGIDLMAKPWKVIVNLKDMHVSFIPRLQSPVNQQTINLNINRKVPKKQIISLGPSKGSTPTVETRFEKNKNGQIKPETNLP